mmetsp:Transcript_11640/g.48429  ORF Transcript_11640/g.48429 Transcript_11640/m.48429 type:complete len:591 (-) Transcript_11640:532-2304(-)
MDRRPSTMNRARTFETLSGGFSKGDYDAVIKGAEKALRSNEKDGCVKAMLAAAYIRSGKFVEGVAAAEEALKDSGLPAALQNDLKYMKAYGLYGNHQYKEALKAVEELRKQKFQSEYLMHLEAQALGRSAKNEEASALYKGMLDVTGKRGFGAWLSQKTVTEDVVQKSEVLTNLTFNLASSGKDSSEIAKLQADDTESQTSEVLFNLACAMIGAGDLDQAEQTLNEAYKKGSKILEAEGASDEDANDELAGILVQLAYVQQLKGQNEAASKSYEKLLSQKISDVAVAAVASNNLAVLKWDAPGRTALGLAKRLKSTTVPGLEYKLTKPQLQIMGCNRAIVNLEMSRLDVVSSEIEALKTLATDNDNLTLIQSSQLSKSKKFDEAEEVLKTIENPLTRKAATAQVKLVRGDFEGAANSLAELRSSPAAIATSMTLYEAAGMAEKASSLVKGVAKEWAQSGRKELAVSSLRDLAEMFHRNNMDSEAVEALRDVLVLSPDDEAAVANIVIASSNMDYETAENYASRLPALQGMQEMDAVELEALPVPRRGVDMDKRRVRIDAGNEENAVRVRPNGISNHSVPRYSALFRWRLF